MMGKKTQKDSIIMWQVYQHRVCVFHLTHGLYISLDDKFLVVFVVGFQFFLKDVDELNRLYEE